MDQQELLALVEQLRRDVESLRAENQQLRAENERLRAENQALRKQLEDAERAATRQAAPFRRPDTRKIPLEQHKRPGRKAGHPGAFRQAPEHIDERVDVPLDVCPRCGWCVEGAQPVVQIKRGNSTAPPACRRSDDLHGLLPLLR